MVEIDTRYGDCWVVDSWPDEWGLPPVGAHICIDDSRYSWPHQWEVTDCHVISTPRDDDRFIVVKVRPWKLKTRLKWRWKKIVYEWIGGERNNWFEPYASSEKHPIEDTPERNRVKSDA